MANTQDKDDLSTEKAAEHLRRLRDTLGPEQLREAFDTGGGLMDHEENRLRQALDVLGTRRSAEILYVEVPESGLPGEQVTIGGEPVRSRVTEEQAEPIPEDTASLSEFNGGEEKPSEVGDRNENDVSGEEREISEASELNHKEAVNVIERALNVIGPDGIKAFLDPDEVSPLGQSVSFQLSGAVETLGKDRIRNMIESEREDR